jgi:hypothetical protein
MRSERRAQLALIAVASPLALGSLVGAAPNGRDGAPAVRLVNICAQATDCKPYLLYICSTKWDDKIDNKCTAGCGGAE